jgi:glycerol-3-phosphate dehydrogenase
MQYDLLIIGGGIQGAGIAQAGAAAGFSVLVLEMTALASGTSSRSSKLIHGGLRYLESAQLRLVRESLHERERLLRLAPDLVHLVPFHVPIYRDSQRRPWQIRAGLSLYAVLGGLGPNTRFQALPRSAWDGLDGLRRDGLQAVFRYFDAQTDDAALTRAVMHSAQSLGAQLQMPARFVAAQIGDHGCAVQYQQAGQLHECHARIVVNAAGAWAGEVLTGFSPALPPPRIELVRGSHLLLPGQLGQGIYYLEAPSDQRAVFAMPYQQHTLVGTTEVIHTGNADTVAASTDEQTYLRDVVGHYFERWRDVEPLRTFAGLRVLPAAPGRAFTRSRETLLLCDRQQQPRVLSVLGGKLTTYRASAETVLAALRPWLPARRSKADTRELTLPAQ